MNIDDIVSKIYCVQRANQIKSIQVPTISNKMTVRFLGIFHQYCMMSSAQSITIYGWLNCQHSYLGI